MGNWGLIIQEIEEFGALDSGSATS